MQIGYFSSIMGTKSGPSIVDRRVLEAISQYDNENTYTVYKLLDENTRGLQLNNRNFSIKAIRPSGKWLGISLGLPLELKRYPVDLLHATFVPPPFVPCKFVMTITCWSLYSQPELYPPFMRWRLLYLLNKGIRNASAIFCYTDFLKNKLIEKFKIEPERVFVTQPGIGEEIAPVEDKENLLSFLNAAGINGPYILFIGSLTKRKNVDGLIRAFNILVRESNIQHKLVLLGETIFLSDDIFNTVKELDLTDRVVFVDRRPHQELPLFYSGADVFVFPTFSEGFGLPPLEAMACATPVVASNVTSVPEVVGDAAVLVDPYKPEDMAQGILKVLTDQQLRNEMIRKGLVRARQFTWQKMAVQIVSAYKKVYQAGW